MPDDVGDLCRAVVDELMIRRGWRLLERDAFIREAAEVVCRGITTTPCAAVWYVYSQTLYHACSGEQGRARRHRAYTELSELLYDRARKKYPDVCDDATQDAIERVYLAFHRCYGPGTFVAFAFHQLKEAARRLWRQAQRLESLDETRDETSEKSRREVPDTREDPGRVILSQEQRAILKQLVADFLQRHPRAALQLAALLLKYIDGLDENTISQQLGKSRAQISVLRWRATQKLRADPRWREWGKDLSIV